MTLPSAADISPNSIGIVGAGIIGLSCAWRLAQSGCRIHLYDSGPAGRGASWAAAGMLAPAFEAAGEVGTHRRLFDLCLASAELWHGFTHDLAAATGLETGYQGGPSLALAKTDKEKQRLAAILDVLKGKDLPVEQITVAEAKTLEPCLGEGFNTALRLPTDGQVDNRRLIAALIAACKKTGLVHLADRQACTDLTALKQRHRQLLITAGWQSGALLDHTIPISPVGGQLLSVARIAGAPQLTIRQGPVYIAPKSDRIVIGATVEPGTVRSEPQTDAIRLLRAEASAICPILGHGPELESWSGTRPATPDHAPVIDEVSPGVFLAAGHYRNGVLLAPLTAKLIGEMMITGDRSELAKQFTAARFATVAAK